MGVHQGDGESGMAAFAQDGLTRHSLTVLADATAEVLGHGMVYQAILDLAERGNEIKYDQVRELFDAQELGDRVRIRDHAMEALGEGDTMVDIQADPDAYFPKIMG